VAQSRIKNEIVQTIDLGCLKTFVGLLKFKINDMKKLFLATTLLMSSMIFGQLHIDTFYQNKNEFLIYSIVKEFDSLPQEVLNTKVKNWGSTNFVNMSEVLVGETKEQLVFNYISKSFYTKTLGMVTTRSWYIRMVVQIKDNKIKISMYDDGNCFWPGSYSGGVSVPATSARLYKIADYFGKKGTCMKMYNGGLQDFKSSCLHTVDDLVLSIKSNTENKDKDGWR